MRPVNNIIPGSTGRSRLVDLLLRSGDRVNNGTTAGGLAHVINSGVRGVTAAREMARADAEKQNEVAALNAMNRGMGAQQWQPPAGERLYSGAGPDAPEISREEFMKAQPAAGGYDGAITALQGLGPNNEPAGRLTQQLMFKRSERDQARADLLEQRAYDESQQPSFEVVNNPYGRGGVGQRNTRTNEIVSYQAPAGPGRGMWAHDRENGSVTMVDEATIRANPERFGPSSEAADPKYMSRRRVVDGNQEVFETSFDGGLTWTVEGEPYPRGSDPTAALLAGIFGGGGGLLDGDGGSTGSAPGGEQSTTPAASPSGPAMNAPAGPVGVSPQDALNQARDALRNGADRAAVEQRLRSMGVDPSGL